MPHGKKKTTGSGTDGKHRKETKEERRLRLQRQAEARENCFKILPYAGGALLVGLVAFALWVRSVPPAPVKLETTPAMPQHQQELDLDMLKNLDPETLLKMGAKLEPDDGDGMATPSKGHDTVTAAAADDGAPPLEDDEEISLDDEEPPAEAPLQEEGKVEEGKEEESVAEEEAPVVEERQEEQAAPEEPDAEEIPPEEQRKEEL